MMRYKSAILATVLVLGLGRRAEVPFVPDAFIARKHPSSKRPTRSSREEYRGNRNRASLRQVDGASCTAVTSAGWSVRSEFSKSLFDTSQGIVDEPRQIMGDQRLVEDQELQARLRIDEVRNPRSRCNPYTKTAKKTAKLPRRRRPEFGTVAKPFDHQRRFCSSKNNSAPHPCSSRVPFATWHHRKPWRPPLAQMVIAAEARRHVRRSANGRFAQRIGRATTASAAPRRSNRSQGEPARARLDPERGVNLEEKDRSRNHPSQTQDRHDEHESTQRPADKRLPPHRQTEGTGMGKRVVPAGVGSARMDA